MTTTNTTDRRARRALSALALLASTLVAPGCGLDGYLPFLGEECEGPLCPDDGGDPNDRGNAGRPGPNGPGTGGPDTGELGAACGGDIDCDSGMCDVDSPGGMCISDGCEGRSTGDFCDGSNPESGICVVTKHDAICYQACVMSGDCRDGYFCTSSFGSVNEYGYGHCMARCEQTGCDTGEVCTSTGACRDAEAAMEQRVERIDLGTVDVTRSSFAWVDVEIPDNGVSFSLTLTPHEPDVAAVFVRVAMPSGDKVFDYFKPEDSPMTYHNTSRTKAALLYPNAPSLDLPPGTYQVQIGATGETKVDVEAFVKSGEGAEQGGRMGINLFFTKMDYLDAKRARTDETFQTALRRLKEIYAASGVILSPITYHDVAEPAATRYAVIDGSMSADVITHEILDGVQREGINMVFVDQWVSSGGYVTLGQAAGIPGPTSHEDAESLGVLVSLSPAFRSSQTSQKLAAIMAHEIGHYMGLQHTTEANGQMHDQLEDTPECGADFDANGDGYLDGVECGTLADNLMFWQASDGQVRGDMSSSQIWVLTRSGMVLP